MHYNFPMIRHISDVLPHIEGREEFIVAEREGYTVVNYVVAMADTFNMYPAGYDGSLSTYDLGGAMRRECRGLIFGDDGHLMSRPFHKFFNINERDETQAHAVDMTQPHVIMEKMDGSMIRPILVDGYLRLATKMGVTNVAMQAEEWLAAQDPALKDWMRKCVEDSVTPLFEWVSPFNQIVLAYEEADLVYLGTRCNTSGWYIMDTSCPFNTVPRYGSVEGNISDYVARQRGAEGREGDIIRFADGHMCKIKNDWYVRIHKTVDRIVFDRNIVNLIVNEEVDDVMPMLPVIQANRVRNFEIRFWNAFKQKENRLYGLRIAAQQNYEDDRKRIALEMVPTLENKTDAQFIFRMLDGSDIRELLLDHVRKSISSNTKWDECAKWMGM